jgi:hypothetical protein
MTPTRWPALLALALLAPPAGAAELILPQNRTAFYADEPIELAVAGLKKGETTALEVLPATKRLTPLKFAVRGDGSTVLAVLPGGSLAPAAYTLRLGDKPAGKFTIASGVNVSPLLLSQTAGNPKAGGGNFIVGNAFGFGLLDGNGRPLRDLRGRRSSGLQAFDNAIAADLPTLVYMYWTGYVTHKPFGSEKSWAAPDMQEATRLLSFHTAQRLRRYARNIISVGTLDEPGLSWGKTPAGGSASGFPNWDEQAWYEKRGWKYTDDPGARPADDWLKYMAIRCAIIKEVNAQAKRDLKSIWPGVVFSTDLYAPQAVMDGTDPLNQEVNEVPSSHVFLDFGVGKLGALSGLYLEKAHDPTARIAHAMNGQLFGPPVPQPAQGNAYRVMRNAMLMAGLGSNWWLNFGGMSDADLAAVNEPGLRLGALFGQFSPRGHDTAVLWSFTEIALREKAITAREARKKGGEQIKLLIASLPDVPGAKGKEVAVNAYDVGGNYKEQVLSAHQALARAGYPAHILHERVLARQLKDYRTLVVVGQTFALPAEVRGVIADWVAKGGQVVVDGTTKVKFPGASVTKADFRDPYFRWKAYFEQAQKKDHPFASNRQASYYLTNTFMDEQVRRAVAPLKETMKKTKPRPALLTDSAHLAVEKHVGAAGGALYLVLNAHEKLPDLPAEQRYSLYNYAPYEATFTLQGIAPDSAVYCFEGDWKTVRQVKDPQGPQKATFTPGEMKLYLVAPRSPGKPIRSVFLNTFLGYAQVHVAASAGSGPHVPWPLTFTLKAPDGTVLYRVHRATGARGYAREVFPLGRNAPAGKYTCAVESPVPGLALPPLALLWKPKPPTLTLQPGKVRVFDGPAIQTFLARKPEVVVAAGTGQKALAEQLVKDLTARGLKATVRPQAEVLRKVPYPRVWNPYAVVYRAAGPEKRPKGMKVTVEVTLGVAADGTVIRKRADGKDGEDWRVPNSLVTVTGTGWVDAGGDREICYEPGVKLYVDERRQVAVVKGEKREEKTTKEFRARWAKPWVQLTTHVGAYQLPPALPEAYTTDHHLILLGDSASGPAVAALQASEVLPQVVDGKYPGPGKALVSFAWSPFAVEKNVILVGAADAEGLAAGVERLLQLAPRVPSAPRPLR